MPLDAKPLGGRRDQSSAEALAAARRAQTQTETFVIMKSVVATPLRAQPRYSSAANAR
jgi:hypothetical protein